MKAKIYQLIVLCFIGYALISPELAFSQGKNPEVLKALEGLKGKIGVNWNVIWYDKQDRVKTLKGKLSLPYPGTPEDAAIYFLRENAAIFQMDSEIMDIEMESTKESLTGYHVRFQQRFSSLPVFNGGVEVHLKKDKSVFMVHSYYLPSINISTSPILSEKDSIEIAQNDFLQNYRFRKDKTGEPQPYEDKELIFKEEPKPHLGVLEYQGKPYLTHKVLLDIESPFALMEYMVDANSGTVLTRRSLIQDFENLDLEKNLANPEAITIDGTGKIFDPNSVNTLNNTGLQDNNDADDPLFNNAYFTKILKDLSYYSGYYFLYGPYVKVTDLVESPYYYPSTLGYIFSTSTGNFDFTRSPDQFEHVMVYYHIDTNQRYIQSLGFTINKRLHKVDPHGLSGADNSHYVANPIGSGYLAFGEGGVDDAEDADVILHEYGHSIQDNQTSGKYLYSGEAGAMGEGFGDYWAASNTYDISIANGFDPACCGEWDQAPNCLRRVDSTKHYPEDLDREGNVHVDGEIWSSALWDMFNDLGKTITDTLVLESHFLVPDNPTFSDGAQALLDADEEIYEGAYRDNICSAMTNRGISASGCGLWITLNWDQLGSDVDLHLRPPGGVAYIGWDYPNDCFYRNTNPDWGVQGDPSDDPLLYWDCIEDCTFEQITLDKVTDSGTYKVLIHYYRDHDLGPTTATIEVFQGSIKVFEGSNTLSNTGDDPDTGDIWIPIEIIIAGGTASKVNVINKIERSSGSYPDLRKK